MSIVAAEPRYTAEDLLTLPDRDRYELVDGRLVERKSSMLSSYVAGVITELLHVFCRTHPLGYVFPEGTSFQCFSWDARRVRKPDTAFLRRDRLTVEQLMQEGHCPVVPDLAVEVISPNDLAYEVDQKANEWLRAGVSLLWVVNPHSRFVRVRRADGSETRFDANDELTGEDVLPGFRCRVAELFELPGGTPAPAANP
jgi:Uma2 family endonuclease